MTTETSNARGEWVPSEPTLAMLEALSMHLHNDLRLHGRREQFREAYTAMLAAAPPPAAARGDVRAVLQEMRDRQVARQFKSQTLTDWADRIEAALAAEGVQAGGVEQRARELLAAEFERDGEKYTAQALRRLPPFETNDVEVNRAIRAIVAALSQNPSAGSTNSAMDVLWSAVDKADRNMWADAHDFRNAVAAIASALSQQPEARGVVRHDLCDCPNGRAEHSPSCAALTGERNG